MNGFNPMQLMKMFQGGGGNMQQMLMQMMQGQGGNNPIMKNALDMANKGDYKGVEEMARNLCKEKGIDPEEAIQKIMTQFGMK